MAILKTQKSVETDPHENGMILPGTMLAGQVYAGEQEIPYLQWLLLSGISLEKRRNRISPFPQLKPTFIH